MHIPALLPDELLAGHLHRVASLNGLESGFKAALMIAEMKTQHRTTCAGRTWFEMYAETCGIDAAHLVRAHTLVPVMQLVVGRGAPISYGDPTYRVREKQTHSWIVPRSSLSCPECHQEDLAFWGFAYLRRSAQLPGIDWCMKHGTQLQDRDAEDPQGEPAILSVEEHRYGEIFGALLDLPRSIPIAQASKRVRDRMRALGLRWRSNAPATSISEWASALMPPSWLKRRWHDFETGQRGQDFDSIHSTLKFPLPTSHYALALTVLYDSSEEALIDFLRPLDDDELAAAAEVAVARGYHRRSRSTRVVEGSGHKILVSR